MNIDDELKNLASEAHELPSRMNIDRIRKTAKRRKTIHTLIVTGRSLLAFICVSFLSLFIGVNTSASFARAASDLPLIGGLSEAMVLRQEIRDSIRHNKDIEDAVTAGDFVEVSMSDAGNKKLFTYKIDSYLADEASLAFFSLLETDLKLAADGFSCENIRITDLKNNEIIYRSQNAECFNKCGIASFCQLYWDRPATDFALDFDLLDPNLYPDNGLCTSEKDRRVDSYHFEFRNVQITPSERVELDRAFTFKDHDIRFTHMLISETATKVFVRFPNDAGFKVSGLDFYITDENGEVISDPRQHNSYSGNNSYKACQAADGSMCYILPSIHYKDTKHIQIHIVSISCRTYDTRLLEVYPADKTAIFDGRKLPIEVYDSSYSYRDFGLKLQPMFYNPENSLLFLIPKEEDMPAFNSFYSELDGGTCTYDLEYPTITKGGKEYIVIQCQGQFHANNPKNLTTCYRFASSEDFENHRLYQRMEVDL